jgi:hypothetical protein
MVISDAHEWIHYCQMHFAVCLSCGMQSDYPLPPTLCIYQCANRLPAS